VKDRCCRVINITLIYKYDLFASLNYCNSLNIWPHSNTFCPRNTLNLFCNRLAPIRDMCLRLINLQKLIHWRSVHELKSFGSKADSYRSWHEPGETAKQRIFKRFVIDCSSRLSKDNLQTIPIWECLMPLTEICGGLDCSLVRSRKASTFLDDLNMIFFLWQ